MNCLLRSWKNSFKSNRNVSPIIIRIFNQTKPTVEKISLTDTCLKTASVSRIASVYNDTRNSRNTETLNWHCKTCLSLQMKRTIHAYVGLISSNSCAQLKAVACLTPVRHKYRTTRESDSESEDSDDEDDYEEFEEEPNHIPKNYKQIAISVHSQRADLVARTALNMSSRELEKIFYGSKVMLNGEKLLKKSKPMKVGDYVDVVIDVKDDKIKVKRVKLIKVYDKLTSKGNLKILVRYWKGGFFVDKPTNFTVPEKLAEDSH